MVYFSHYNVHLYIIVVMYMSNSNSGELMKMNRTKQLVNENRRYAKLRWRGLLGGIALRTLVSFTKQFQFSVASGDLLFLDNGWYVTHSGLTSLACRKKCAGIKVHAVSTFCNPAAQRWAFE